VGGVPQLLSTTKKEKKNMDVRSRRARETSPDRVKVYMHQQQQQQQRVKPVKKVQVVYYLSRNGNLEHPHYMEVTHLPNQPLRLRGKTKLLTALLCFRYMSICHEPFLLPLCFSSENRCNGTAYGAQRQRHALPLFLVLQKVHIVYHLFVNVLSL
jgi:hypothetical protein